MRAVVNGASTVSELSFRLDILRQLYVPMRLRVIINN